MEGIVRFGRLGVAVLAVAVAAGLFGATWPERRRTTARLLLAVAAVLMIGSLAQALVAPSIAGASLPVPFADGASEQQRIVLGAVTTVVAGGCWSLFAFRYSGRSGPLFRALAGCVGLLGLASLLAGAWVARGGSSPAAIALLSVLLLATSAVVIVGVVSLLWVSIGANAYPFGEPVALASGAIALLAGVPLAQVSEAPSLYPATVALAAGLFLVPVVRYPVFDTLPAARIAGRDRVVDEMAAGVLVLDEDGDVHDANPRAEALFSERRSALRGRPVTRLLPDLSSPADVADAPDPRLVTTEDGTILELTGDRVTGQRDRQFGYLLLCEDVTDQRIRGEQLTLLRRFVVDVVGTRMEAVRADAAAASSPMSDLDVQFATGTERSSGVEDASVDAVDGADRIWRRATDLTELVAHARSVEQAIAQGDDRPREPTELRRTVRAVAEEVTDGAADRTATEDGTDRATNDDGTGDPSIDDASEDATLGSPTFEPPTLAISLPDEPVTTDVPRALLQPVLRSLLDAAEECGATTIDVVVLDDSPDDDRPTVRVCDDRPIEADDGDASAGDGGDASENPSVAVARLAIEQLGGSVSSGPASDDTAPGTKDDRRGHCVTIELPAANGADGNDPHDSDGEDTNDNGSEIGRGDRS